MCKCIFLFYEKSIAFIYVRNNGVINKKMVTFRKSNNAAIDFFKWLNYNNF